MMSTNQNLVTWLTHTPAIRLYCSRCATCVAIVLVSARSTWQSLYLTRLCHLFFPKPTELYKMWKISWWIPPPGSVRRTLDRRHTLSCVQPIAYKFTRPSNCYLPHCKGVNSISTLSEAENRIISQVLQLVNCPCSEVTNVYYLLVLVPFVESESQIHSIKGYQGVYYPGFVAGGELVLCPVVEPTLKLVFKNQIQFLSCGAFRTCSHSAGVIGNVCGASGDEICNLKMSPDPGSICSRRPLK